MSASPCWRRCWSCGAYRVQSPANTGTVRYMRDNGLYDLDILASSSTLGVTVSCPPIALPISSAPPRAAIWT